MEKEHHLKESSYGLFKKLWERQVYQWWRLPEKSCFQLLTEPPMFEESCFMNAWRFTEKTGQHGDAFKIVTVENDSQTIKPNRNNELQHDPISGW